jgi:hypothetical protein
LKQLDFVSADYFVLKSPEACGDPIRDLAALNKCLDGSGTSSDLGFSIFSKDNSRLAGFAISDSKNLFECQALAV